MDLSNVPCYVWIALSVFLVFSGIGVLLAGHGLGQFFVGEKDFTSNGRQSSKLKQRKVGV